MTDIVKAETGALSPGDWNALREQAKAIVTSGFLPKAINTPEKAITIMLAGRELGIGPMQAIRSIHVIDGKPVLSADLMAGLVHQRVRGALLRVVESTNEICTIDAARPGQEPTRFEFSIEDAKAAGLTGKDNWKKYPRAMLRARCIAEAARAVFPDAVAGAYVEDELQPIVDPNGGQSRVQTWVVVGDEDAPQFHSADEADQALKNIEAAQSREELMAARPYTTPAEYDTWSPEDRRRLNKAFKARERIIANLEQQARAATSQDEEL